MKKLIELIKWLLLLPFMPFIKTWELIWCICHPLYWDTKYTYSSEFDKWAKQMLKSNIPMTKNLLYTGRHMQGQRISWGTLDIKKDTTLHGKTREYFTQGGRPSRRTIHKMRFREINDLIKNEINA